MQRSLAQAAALLLVRRRSPSSFPAGIRRAAIRSAVPMVAILLMSAAFGAGTTARAEPVVAMPTKNASAADPYAGFVLEAAHRFGVPAAWISAVIAMESDGDPLALSPRGAVGLMQIMPDTWIGLRARHGLGADPYEPRDNILAGAAYLRELHDRYGAPGFLAAYNAGPARYDEYLATGRELPEETQLYVAMLAPLIGEGQVDGVVTVGRHAMSWQESPLFVARDRDRAEGTPSSIRTSPDRSSNSASAVGASALTAQAGELFARRGNAKRLP